MAKPSPLERRVARDARIGRSLLDLLARLGWTLQGPPRRVGRPRRGESGPDLARLAALGREARALLGDPKEPPKEKTNA